MTNEQRQAFCLAVAKAGWRLEAQVPRALTYPSTSLLLDPPVRLSSSAHFAGLLRHTTPLLVSQIARNKIPQIENLGATEDHFDVLDLSDNDITKLDGFPLLNRITSIFASNNRISSIAEDLGSKLQNLETLILINNRIENLADLDSLATCTKLHTLALMKNNVTAKTHYRLYLINKLPSLKILDFRKIKDHERAEAKKVFGGKEGDKLKKEIASLRSVPSQSAANDGLTPEQKQRIKDAILRSQSLEEIQKLELILQSGKMPKDFVEKEAPKADGGDAMDTSK